ncbi:DUF1868 domain-containing protein [Kaistia terrae]|uniref:DUF1868 domain-containing protein n=1 Tax=Kaistia terrae TaxID=537017 RepID=A0ABW0PUI0_9HYPH|nr:DUF1868 domain-containing protein [Kaistia terrae]MCX5577624.1 DUF1868 domain-containing protein [Kaistia terrae]
MTTTLAAASLARYAASAQTMPPRHLGRRYDRSGVFLPEPGNTVVCHLAEGSKSQAAIVEVRRRMMAMPDAGQLAFTPVSSLHMTLFQGILEGRRTLPYWPESMALDSGIDAMTRHYLDRLQDFRDAGPFRVKVMDVVPTGLTVAGATEADRSIMKAWRNALAESFGYRHPDHDDYSFHVTLAYMIDWIAEDRLPAWEALFDECRALIAREAPILELRPPAFCSFDDMNHFEELLVLG